MEGVIMTAEEYLDRKQQVNEYLNNHINEVSGKFTIAKTLEECNELAVVLAQILTKPHKQVRNDLTSEIADVELFLSCLKKTLNINKVEILLKKEEKIIKLTQLKIKYAPNFGQL